MSAFAHKNYGCRVTGVTLSKNQTAFGNERIVNNVRPLSFLFTYALTVAQGGDPDRAKIICCDARYIPGGKGAYTKIVSLEMAEVRAYKVWITMSAYR